MNTVLSTVSFPPSKKLSFLRFSFLSIFCLFGIFRFLGVHYPCMFFCRNAIVNVLSCVQFDH